LASIDTSGISPLSRKERNGPQRKNGLWPLGIYHHFVAATSYQSTQSCGQRTPNQQHSGNGDSDSYRRVSSHEDHPQTNEEHYYDNDQVFFQP
jgi:hypothetical protein